MDKTYTDLFPPGQIQPRGLCHVTGPPGVGKSLFAIGLIAEGLDPKRVAVLDCEQSLMIHDAQLGFGVYHDIIAMRSRDLGITAQPRHLFQMMASLVNDIPDRGIDPEHEVDLIIVDNVSPLESGIVDEVETNHESYGITPGQMRKMEAVKWGPIKRLYSNFIQNLANKAPLYVFTSQLSQVWAPRGGPVPGLFRPKGKKDILEQQTFLRVWLQLNSSRPEPSGLVMKSRLVRPIRMNGGKLIWQSMLPRRLPVCTWGAIREYFAAPPDLENPAPGETPSPQDWYKLRGTLSPDQLEVFKLLARESEAKETHVESTQALPITVAEFIVRLQELGLTLPDALGKLGKELAQLNPSADFARLREEA